MAELASRTRPGPALAVEGLTYSYPNAAVPALLGVSLELGRGELALLAGRSACGKSTLLRAACGLVPHFHGGEIEGSVEVAGRDAIVVGPGELTATVGYVAQDPETQVVSTTVAAPDTRTISARPTDIVADSDTAWPTVSAMFSWTSVAKPCSVYVAEYRPDGNCRNTKRPSLDVTSMRVRLVPTSRTTTVTPGSVPPLGSVTVP